MAKSSARIRRSSGSDGSRRTYLIVGAIIVLFVGGFIALAVVDARQQSASGAPDDVKTYDVGPAGQAHVRKRGLRAESSGRRRAQPCLAELRLLRQARPRRERRPLPGARGGLDHLLPRPPAGSGNRAAEHRPEPVLHPGQPLSRPRTPPWWPRPGASRSPSTARTTPTWRASSRPTAWPPDPRTWRRLHRRHQLPRSSERIALLSLRRSTAISAVSALDGTEDEQARQMRLTVCSPHDDCKLTAL